MGNQGLAPGERIDMNKKVVFLGALAALIAAGAYAVYHSMQAQDKLRLSGNVDIREVNLSFRVGGRLHSLKVDEGTSVHAGDVLGELDSDTYQLALAEAQAALASAEAKKNLYHQGNRPEDIQQARANLETRLSVLSNAQQAYERQRQLSGSGASSEKLLDDSKAARDQAAAQVEAFRQQFQVLSRGFRKEEIAQADADFQRATASLDSAKLQLADTRLIAPADGTILTRAVEPGSMLAAGNTVFTLSLNNPVWVRAYVSEAYLGQFAPGQKVRISTDSNPKSYDAVVGFVSPTAEFTPKNVETTDLRTALVYRLRLIVSKPDSQLRQGMPVSVTLAE
jgi:HlyD family secretion protein